MGEADPTAKPGATDTDDKGKGEADPTALTGATDTDDLTSDDASKKKEADSKSKGQDDKDWEASYKGLQPKYQALVEEQKTWEDDRLKLGGQIAELETTVKATAETVKGMEEESKKAEDAAGDLQKTIDGLEAKVERNDLIMSDYPQLAEMESKGLLPPDLEGEELKAKLDSMSEVLQEQGVTNTGAKIKGSTGDDDVTTGKRSQGDDVASLTGKIMEANQQGDVKEAARLTSLLLEAQNKKFAAAGIGVQDIDQSE
jgi:chromosome segregation ATPase